MDDVQALARLKEGDREAFEQLYRKYWRRLYDAAYRRLLSREDSEEVIQDLFVYIWSKRDTLQICFGFKFQLGPERIDRSFRKMTFTNGKHLWCLCHHIS